MVEQTRRQRDTLVELESEVHRHQLKRGGSGGVLLDLLHDDSTGEKSPLSRLAREEAGEKSQDKRSGAGAGPPAGPAALAETADEEGDETGWLLSCEAGRLPAEVTAELRRYLEGLDLVVIDLEPAVWAEQAALSARLRQVLQLPPDLPEPLDFSHPVVRAALDVLCARDTLLLLRPKKWQPKRSIEWAARLLRAVEEAFDRSSQRPGAESREVAAVLFGWRGHMRVNLGEPGNPEPMTVMKVHPLADLETSGAAAAAAAAAATPAATAAATPAAAAAATPAAPATPAAAFPAAAASPGQDVRPGSRAAAAAATPPASGARTPGSAAGAAAVEPCSPGEQAEGSWLFSCEAGTAVSSLLTELGLDATTRVLELNTADLRYAANEQLRAEGAFLLALAEGSGHGATPPPVAAEGQFWPTARNLLASLVEADSLLVLRGAWQPQPPGRRAGNPAGRRSAVPLFVHCVSLAYGDATSAGKEAEVVAVVVEGGTRTIQGTWIDSSSFDHTVAEL